MAKSKRSKIVHQTKIGKKGKEHKTKLFEKVQEASSQYQHIWLVRVENMRNLFVKKVRLDFADSKIFIGGNKVMAKALGKNANDELLEGVHQLSGKLTGDIGLIFTNEPIEKVQEYMDELCEIDYSRAGCTAPESVVVRGEDCPLHHQQTEQPISATAEPHLRQCGLPTMLRGGSIMLVRDSYEVCKEGDQLNSTQCRLLKLLGVPLSHFRIHLVGHFTAGKYTTVDGDEMAA